MMLGLIVLALIVAGLVGVGTLRGGGAAPWES